MTALTLRTSSMMSSAPTGHTLPLTLFPRATAKSMALYSKLEMYSITISCTHPGMHAVQAALFGGHFPKMNQHSSEWKLQPLAGIPLGEKLLPYHHTQPSLTSCCRAFLPNCSLHPAAVQAPSGAGNRHQGQACSPKGVRPQAS